MKDARYSVRKEWTGKNSRQWVFRFCDDWISSHALRRDAYIAAREHADNRKKEAS